MRPASTSCSRAPPRWACRRIATTDHGYVFGAYEFWSKARSYGIKPIIGVEAYLTPGTHRRDKTRVRWGDERPPAATT